LITEHEALLYFTLPSVAQIEGYADVSIGHSVGDGFLVEPLKLALQLVEVAHV